MSYELYTTKHWMILPSFVHGILPTLMYNSNNHIALTVAEKKQPYLAIAGSDEYIRNSQVTEDGEVLPRYNWDGTNLLSRMKEPFVNVIPVDGPITRNGDACSYGSKEIRDWLMEAAANKYCRAHVLVVNTPGGSAWAKNDFQQAIDFAHDNGQRVYMLIDGLCASAGMYLASFCDEVYVVNLKDQLGCVGVMASFFTLKNGDKNQFNSETYHEYYATKSVNKNKEYRDIAEDDDATLLIAELDELEAEFRSDMQKSFPSATDEHLDGKVFDADEVMGILCDGQMLLGDVVARAFDVANGNEEPIARTANRNIGQPADISDDDEDQMEAALKNAEAAAEHIADIADNKTNVSQKNSTIMDEKYQIVAQVLGVEELQVTEEGTFLNKPLLDTLTEKLTEMKAKEAKAAAAAAQEETPATEQPAEEAPATEAPAVEEEKPAEEEQKPTEEAPATEEEQKPAEEEEKPAEEKPAEEEEKPTDAPATEEAVQAATEEINKIQETLHNAEQMIADKDKEIEDLKSDMEGKDNSIEQLQANIDQARKDIETANATIAEHVATITERDATITGLQENVDKLTKQVSDLKAEIKEMAGKPAPMANADSGIPADNGTGDAPEATGTVRSTVNANMSPEEIRDALRKRDAETKARGKRR